MSTERERLGQLIGDSRVLVIGTGGVGCDLLKCLVGTGFRKFDIVDLDTIDMSNLNRQFLFRRKHVGMPKCIVAREAVMQICPHAEVVAHHANIKDPKFSPDFVRQFSMVLCALDNIDARRHVNRLCLAADVPMIESGSTGYDGHCTIIIRNRTECYECSPKPAPKTYPVCTIRNNPSQPIHCIVWAKMLFNQLFGESEQSVTEVEATAESSPNVTDASQSKSFSVKQLVNVMNMNAKDIPAFIISKVFVEDIKRLLLLSDSSLWQDTKPPCPIADINVQAVEPSRAFDDFRRVHSPDECLRCLYSCMTRLIDRCLKSPPLVWDKDDDDMLDFVAFTSNLRSSVFHVEMLSAFDVKEKAGNIIPAIAMTNSIVAALMVRESCNVLCENEPLCGFGGDKHRMVYVRKEPQVRGRVILSSETDPPNCDCAVCSAKYCSVGCNMKVKTLGDLMSSSLSHFGMQSINVWSGVSGLYESGDDLDDSERQRYASNSAKCLSDLKCDHLTIEDDDSNRRIELNLVHDESLTDITFKTGGLADEGMEENVMKKPRVAD